jgi:hypothetical protein
MPGWTNPVTEKLIHYNHNLAPVAFTFRFFAKAFCWSSCFSLSAARNSPKAELQLIGTPKKIKVRERLTDKGIRATFSYERKVRIMKSCFILLIALAAGAASAQPPLPDQTLETTIPVPTQQSPIIYNAWQEDEIDLGRGVALDGVAIEAIKSPRHLEIFNPFDPANAGPTPDNTVWTDEHKTKAVGWSIFTLRF